MQAELSKEQNLFREIVSRFFREASPPEAVRALMASERGYDQGVWQQLAEAGFAGTHIPECHGGSGLGPIELGIVAQEAGRYLYCGPFFASSAMAGSAVLAAASEESKERFLPGIADGTTLATLVLDDLDQPERVGQAIAADDLGRLSGEASIVVDAHVADQLIVIAAAGGDLALYSLGAGEPGVSIERLESMDLTRKLSRVALDGASGDKLGELSQTSLGLIWDQLCTALAHEMIGGAYHLLESTVAYTKERYQFGRPIGSFQALKHRCADLLMELEVAKALTHHAARCLATGEGEPYAASMAKAAAGDAYMSAAKAAIQLRGGIGFTWEDDTHLWFKRAKSSEVLLGTPAMHRERMMVLLEETA